MRRSWSQDRRASDILQHFAHTLDRFGGVLGGHCVGVVVDSRCLISESLGVMSLSLEKLQSAVEVEIRLARHKRSNGPWHGCGGSCASSSDDEVHSLTFTSSLDILSL